MSIISALKRGYDNKNNLSFGDFMCTAIRLEGEYHLFGRTLDVDREYGQEVCILPKNQRVEFCHLPPIENHPAILGMAVKFEGRPLFFDGVNENGLCVAALNFPLYAVYHNATKEKINIASYEFITYILCNCNTVDDAENLLKCANITPESISEKLPLTPLHWIIADKKGSITVESVAEGLKVYKNPVGVLTNSPEFSYQITRLSDYMTLSTNQPNNTIYPSAELKQYSGGMGGIGLPGDFSSTSRFVRATFVKNNIVREQEKKKSINQFFHILDAVSVPKGCVTNEDGNLMHTAYSCCIDPSKPAYYFTTYDNREIVKKRLET